METQQVLIWHMGKPEVVTIYARNQKKNQRVYNLAEIRQNVSTK